MRNHIILTLIHIGLVHAMSASEAGTYAARVYNKNRWIEMNDEALIGRTSSSGIAFSGGGARAFVSAMGQLAALRELGLLKNVRYISGISGGGWATMAYSYHTTDTDEFLSIRDGNASSREPESLRLDALREPIPNDQAIGFATANFVETILKHAIHGVGAYARALQDIYLTPSGITPKSFFSWNDSTVADVLARNPNLSEDTFAIVPNAQPFPIIGTTLLYPVEYSSDSCDTNKNYTMIEVSPLYVGTTSPNVQVVEYVGGIDHDKISPSIVLGGAIEPFAFGGASPDTLNGSSQRDQQFLNVPVSSTPWTLEQAIASGSWAPGMFIGTHWYIPNDIAALEWPYWSPSSATVTPLQGKNNRFGYADGGCFENMHLIGLILRGVRSIVAFENVETPLQGSDKWNPAAGDVPSDENMGITIPVRLTVSHLSTNAMKKTY